MFLPVHFTGQMEVVRHGEPGKNCHIFPPSALKTRENNPVVFKKLLVRVFPKTFSSNILGFTIGYRIPVSHQVQQVMGRACGLQLSNRGMEIIIHNKKVSNWQHFWQFWVA